jgi:lipopolysaccharide export system ATP-binding protein
VLREVSVSVQSGEVLGLLGPSGAGKSTLFEALAGELPVASGEIVLVDLVLGAMPLHVRARRGLSYLPQGASVLHDLSALDNLRTFAALAGLPHTTRQLSEHLARFSFAARASVRARDLSGGERRRLELARATLRGPVVLLADEPFAGMDPRSVADVARTLRELADAGLAIVISDHHAEQVLAIADRAVLLVDGAVEAESDAATFAALPVVSGRYLHGLAQGPPNAPT